ncbi:mucin-5AC-like [Haliotis asinina]|uniref:mucin-5AC-like n=1 Tax=Haliotis asinina TaxID=109174 RepID=UPI0035322208
MAQSASFKTLCLGFLLFSAIEAARVKRQAVANSACQPLPAPTNGKINCASSDDGFDYICTATCNTGFQFKTNEASVERGCDPFDGSWYDGKDIPECQPVCSPGCLHGGSCMEPNKCACIDGWRGTHCQHAPSLCQKPSPPMFGSIQCKADSSATVCTVGCAPTFKFKTPPAPEYRCSADGTWSPPKESIPDCVQDVVVAPSVQPTGSLIHPEVNGDATCVTWGQDHYRTFDNRMYTFQGKCHYLLAKDCAFNTFDIHVINDGNCSVGKQCKREIDIYMGSTKISLRQGVPQPLVTWNDQPVKVPGAHDGVVYELVGSYITVRTGLGFKVKWDGKESIFVQVADDLKGKTCGLCGRYDGDPNNDFETDTGKVVTSAASFATTWKKELLDGSSCPDISQHAVCKMDTAQNAQKARKASDICQQLMSDASFSACHSVVDVNPYIEACKTDCCNGDQNTCMCNTFEAYSRECMSKKVKFAWRRSDRCPVVCQRNMIFKECGSPCPKRCQDSSATCIDDSCVDGCFCPDGTVLHNGECIAADTCPCDNNGHEFSHGATIPRDCNTCTCYGGKWNCTNKKCEATCSATGDPHYMTFDGFRYNFMGTCSYYLLYDPNFDVIVDNIKCGHGEASCTKSVTLDVNGMNIKLDHNHQLFVNGKEITKLPYKAQGIKIFMVSSLFMQAELDNGIKILWDGRTRAYITAPPSFMKKTKGLCGYFDGNQNNDFLTKEGDIETNVNAFGNRWKTEASCRDMPTTPQAHPCDLNAQRKAKAVAECEKLKSDTFKECHDVVDVDQFYDDCLYDTCACTDNLKDCMCPNFGEYADTCAAKGIKINWRSEITECALVCTGGQEYQVCGSPCARTCRNIAENEACQERCVEGCNCPPGESLNNDGECVSITQCPCIFDEREYEAGFTTIKGDELCECVGAKWHCQNLHAKGGSSTLPTTKPIQSLCEENKEYTDCVSACPVTCDNVHDPPTCTTTTCEPGCVCKPGFVKEGDRCVEAGQCPCHHGGKAYFENQKIVMDCNECTCKSRKWECEMKDCPAICSTYGDSHYKSFDGKPFEFQGNCDYILAKSTDSNPYKFLITTENIPCGTSGVTCTKAIEFSVGEPGSANFYRLNLVRGKPVTTEPGSPFDIRDVGNFLYVNTTFGITMQWDKGTTLYIRLSTPHRNKVAGLCGNFNGDQKDDFQMPQGGPPAVKATTFGDSWKVHDYCAPSTVITDTCDAAPHRKPWAQKKCGIMQSDLFEPCHGVVPYQTYMDKCIFDACACDLGGDCECLCTAIAAYAHECAVKGVPIRWRSNELCAIECTDCFTYNPCISTCPKKTCDNRLVYDQLTQECKQDLCFEGCDAQPCLPGQVYDTSVSPMKCIPEPFCNTTACVLNGRAYREGERITDETICRSECEICTCTNGELKRMGYCTGSTPFISTPSAVPTAQPTVSPTVQTVSSETATPYVTTAIPPACLRTGWTSWMSSSVPTPANIGDIETISGLRKSYSFCDHDMMSAIDCRVVGQKTKAEMSGQKVTCNLREGLKCYHKDQSSGLCLDYEVRYYCDCSATPSASPVLPGQSGQPTVSPSAGGLPTASPGVTPKGGVPSASPSAGQSSQPTVSPSAGQSGLPTASPSAGGLPTASPGVTGQSGLPTASPSAGQSSQPTASPSAGQSGLPTASPSAGGLPTASPGVTGQSGQPTVSPSAGGLPTASPGVTPKGGVPSASPSAGQSSQPTASPSAGPSGLPTASPGVTGQSGQPTASPSAGGLPTASPGVTGKSGQPTASPSAGQSGLPTASPSAGGLPTASPGVTGQSGQPTASPSAGGLPTASPGVTGKSGQPTASPSAGQSGLPTASPSAGGQPTASPGVTGQSGQPTASPSAGGLPTASPGVTGKSGQPTASPSTGQSGLPTASPSAGGQPTASPGVTGQSGLPTASPSTGQSGLPTSSVMTKAPYSCTEGWSAWMNIDRPTISHSFEFEGEGDHEDLEALRYYYSFCAKPSSVQCRSATSGKMYHLTADMGTECNIKQGFLCANSKQATGTCDDYEISVFCECGQTPTAVPTAKPTLAPGYTTPKPGQPFESLPSCMWTQWMNSFEKKPGTDGDYETLSNLRLKYPFCEEPVAIQCRVKPTPENPSEISYEKSGGMGVSCNLNRGLVCVDSMQPKGKTCLDYEVRVYCTDACPSTVAPEGTPTAEPPKSETGFPTASPPSGLPEQSGQPTASPSAGQTGQPTASPGVTPKGGIPSASPSAGQSGQPTASPGVTVKSGQPTVSPSAGGQPTASPGVTGKTGQPTASPSAGQSGLPTASPSAGGQPTASPGVTGKSGQPTASPSAGQSGLPTASPSAGQSGQPTASPGVTPKGGVPSASPSAGQSGQPTASPSAGQGGQPTASPSAGQSGLPTASPSAGGLPTASPGVTGQSGQPTASPSAGQSGQPTASPGVTPKGGVPSASPSAGQSGQPTASPSAGQGGQPTASPSAGQSGLPTASPSAGGLPTASPGVTGQSGQPTASPSAGQSGQPTASPGVTPKGGVPSASPSAGQSGQPTASPSAGQSLQPTASPSAGQSGLPTSSPGIGFSGQPTASPSGVQGGTPTASVQICREGWTGWINSDKPTTGHGDAETVNGIAGYPKTCMKVLSAECRVAETKADYRSTGQHVNCDSSGLECINGEGQQCADYEVRFYCYCGEETTPGEVPLVTPTAGPTVSPVVGVSGQPETIVCNHGWTSMMNEARPGDADGGDLETIDKLRKSNKFCDASNIISIECVVAGTNTGHEMTGQQVTCDKQAGLLCFNSKQSNGQCLDYAVRFFCDCAQSTPYNPVVTTYSVYTGSNEVTPSLNPSAKPSVSPVVKITSAPPSIDHSGMPTASPIPGESGSPSAQPPTGSGGQPTSSPGIGLTGQPTASPSAGPSGLPTASPSAGGLPTASPGVTGKTGQPTASPSAGQSGIPTASPSAGGLPTASPGVTGKSGQPTASPSAGQSGLPTASPSAGGQPTVSPGVTGKSGQPTASPSAGQSGQPTASPSAGGLPTASPGVTGKSGQPTASPSAGQSGQPTASPSAGGLPTASPGVTGKSGQPTASPSAGGLPTASPGVTGKSGQPTASPSAGQSGQPTASPSAGGLPTASPGVTGKSGQPTASPSAGQSGLPTASPSAGGQPTASPGVTGKSGQPTASPSAGQSGLPTASPSAGGLPTASPGVTGKSGQPTASPSAGQSGLPTASPSAGGLPTASPGVTGQTGQPTASPVVGQSGQPTASPGVTVKSGQPTASPSAGGLPTASPSTGQSGQPTASPGTGPTNQPQVVTTCASYWSQWFNLDKPTTGGGDNEFVSHEDLNNKHGFCSGGEITDIQCFGLDTQAYSYSTGEITQCDLKTGFSCKNADNAPFNCQDYQIRYFCQVCALVPTAAPSAAPSGLPGQSGQPTASPSAGQSGLPTASPGITPKGGVPSASPSAGQSGQPTASPSAGGLPTASPSAGQSGQPTASPSAGQSGLPTAIPGITPKGGVPSASPSAGQSGQPTASPSAGGLPTASPSAGQSGQPTASPSAGQSGQPTASPGVTPKGGVPSASPSAGQSGQPTASPSAGQSGKPTSSPVVGKSGLPTASPSAGGLPTASPSAGQSGQPTASPSAGQSGQPTASPGVTPKGGVPSASPSAGQSGQPTASPSAGGLPTASPSAGQSGQPTASPSAGQTGLPTASPSGGVSGVPTPGPGHAINNSPSAKPHTVKPTSSPSYAPVTKTTAIYTTYQNTITITKKGESKKEQTDQYNIGMPAYFG